MNLLIKLNIVKQTKKIFTIGSNLIIITNEVDRVGKA